MKKVHGHLAIKLTVQAFKRALERAYDNGHREGQYCRSGCLFQHGDMLMSFLTACAGFALLAGGIAIIIIAFT